MIDFRMSVTPVTKYTRVGLIILATLICGEVFGWAMIHQRPAEKHVGCLVIVVSSAPARGIDEEWDK